VEIQGDWTRSRSLRPLRWGQELTGPPAEACGAPGRFVRSNLFRMVRFPVRDSSPCIVQPRAFLAQLNRTDARRDALGMGDLVKNLLFVPFIGGAF